MGLGALVRDRVAAVCPTRTGPGDMPHRLSGRSSPSPSRAAAAPAQPIKIVAAENVYGDIARQIGGDEVAVTSILTNPDQDPHEFEASPSTARALGDAAIVVYNGADYDPWAQSCCRRRPRPRARSSRSPSSCTKSRATIRMSGTTRRAVSALARTLAETLASPRPRAQGRVSEPACTIREIDDAARRSNCRA